MASAESLSVGQVWRGVAHSYRRTIVGVTDDGDFLYFADDPTVEAVIDVRVVRLSDPCFPSLMLVEAIGVTRAGEPLEYREEVERVMAGKRDEDTHG